MGIRLKNKGQFFLITAVMIIVTLIILKTNVDIPSVVQKKRELEGRFEKEFFINTANELVKTIEISYHQSNNITRNVHDFANFTRKKMIERSLDFQFLYVGSITPNSSVPDKMNVSIINLLNKPINLTLILNSTTPQTFNHDNMIDYNRNDTSFDINQDTHYILTVSYNGTYEENVTIETESKKSKYVGLFDITLIGSETTYKDKFQKSYTLP